MDILRFEQDFAVCKLPSVPERTALGIHTFLAITRDEISLVAPAKAVPAGATAMEDGWTLFRIGGSLDFSLIGIIAKIATVLAEASVSIFVVSSFDTDYFLVRKAQAELACGTLTRAGYRVLPAMNTLPEQGLGEST